MQSQATPTTTAAPIRPPIRPITDVLNLLGKLLA